MGGGGRDGSVWRVSKRMLGEERTDEWVEKTGIKKRSGREKISHAQNQGVNVSEHVL